MSVRNSPTSAPAPRRFPASSALGWSLVAIAALVAIYNLELYSSTELLVALGFVGAALLTLVVVAAALYRATEKRWLELHSRAMASIAAGHLEVALTHLRALADLPQQRAMRDSVQMRMAEIYRRLGRHDEQDAVLRESGVVWLADLYRGRRQLEADDVGEALASFERARVGGAPRPEPWLWAAVVHDRHGDRANAMKLLEEVSLRFPQIEALRQALAAVRRGEGIDPALFDDSPSDADHDGAGQDEAGAI
jgi:Flp pilus assembly protein TadD